MAMASGLYGLTIEKMFENTAAIDLDTDSFKLALVTDTYTPNFNTHDEYADITNEVVGTGYTATGQALDSVTSAIAAGLYTWDAADEAWTTATFTARGGVIYDDTIAADPLLLAVTFGSDFSVTAGTFTVVWNASGIWTLDYTP